MKTRRKKPDRSWRCVIIKKKQRKNQIQDLHQDNKIPIGHQSISFQFFFSATFQLINNYLQMRRHFSLINHFYFFLFHCFRKKSFTLSDAEICFFYCFVWFYCYCVCSVVSLSCFFQFFLRKCLIENT